MHQPQRTFSGPKMTIISINIEGISACKEELLQDLCQQYNCDVLCIQETHRDGNQKRPKIQGMRLAAERPHRQYGSAIFIKPNMVVQSTNVAEENEIEILTVELTNCTITSVYKPPHTEIKANDFCQLDADKTHFVVGDFNSHSSLWGYRDDDRNGEAVIQWADASKLTLLHDNKLPASFNSARWRRGFNPDLVFVSDRINLQCVKGVCLPIPNTQHRPIMCQVMAIARPHNIPFRRRYNFQKANWTKFQKLLDCAVDTLEPIPSSYDSFVDTVKKCSRLSIPRGCNTNYIQGLTTASKAQLENYLTLFEANALGEDTIEAGKRLITSISGAKRENWTKLMEELDMSISSHKAWRLLKRLNNDPTKSSAHANVTADQIAAQLVKNGKPDQMPPKKATNINRIEDNETTNLSTPFRMEELNAAIKKCKPRKAAGLDDILTEQIKHFGTKTKRWLLNMYNACLQQCKLPNIWRKAKIIAILKPGKEANNPKSYRPISLLCHTYKIFERLIHNRLSPTVDPILIPQQAGFRPEKSCTAQVLNLTQHIEDGFQGGYITGAIFIDLTAAYDTINLRLLMQKIYHTTKDINLTNIIRNLLQNRRFLVEFQGKRSRWRNQRNGLPQGSVLAPLLFNIYTNDQPLPEGTKSYIYADDRAITAQGKTFEEVEQRLSGALVTLDSYYRNNQLKPNPAKTQVCAFHLKNKQARRKLQVEWKGIPLEHCPNPRYLGVTLDRALTFKRHCLNTKLKVSGRNNIVRKLTSSNWGAKPGVLKASALALCHSAGEYACPVWYSSAHAKQVDVALNETSRIITGCLKPTPLSKIHHLAGIAPPAIRREAAALKERSKAATSERHPFYGLQPAHQRLKSRRSFLRSTEDYEEPKTRVDLWRKTSNQHWMKPNEELAPGGGENWEIWKALNRLRTDTARSKDTLNKWGYPWTPISVIVENCKPRNICTPARCAPLDVP